MKVILSFLWVLFLAHFVTYIYPIGLISDDVLIVKRAGEDMPLWTIHYSYFLSFLWKMLADGTISPQSFKVIALITHIANCLLFYRLLRGYFNLDSSMAFLGSTLFLFSAAGLEAIAWNCCLGYLFTAFFLLLALEYLSHPLILAVIQLLAVMSWDWGVIIAPMCLAALYFQKRSLKIIIPAVIVLIGYLVFRSTLPLEATYKKNSILDMAKFLFGSPLLILLPNMGKAFFGSMLGVIGALIIALVLFIRARPAFILFTITLVPWIIGGHPSSRYFYLSAPFLFAGLLPYARFLAYPILLIQVLFSFQRIELWAFADQEAKRIGEEIVKAFSTTPADKKFVVVNVPDAYGPESLPMRPQVWHCGIDALCDRIISVKTPGAPFMWNEETSFMSRKEIQEKFSNAAIFEVVLEKNASFTLFQF